MAQATISRYEGAAPGRIILSHISINRVVFNQLILNNILNVIALFLEKKLFPKFDENGRYLGEYEIGLLSRPARLTKFLKFIDRV